MGWRETLGEETAALFPTRVVDRIPAPSTGEDVLAFARDYLSASRPVVISGLVDHWPALTKWNDRQYLVDKLANQTMTVSVTPNGRADAVTLCRDQLVFARPAEIKMGAAQFLARLDDSRESVAYYSAQNDCLRAELPKLLDDVEEALPMAKLACGNLPEAVNLWWGGASSLSRLHKDPFDNFYVVVTGRKQFTLLPPSDIAFLSEQPYPSATYRASNVAKPLELTMDEPAHDVRWIAEDPDEPDFDAFPGLKRVTALKCSVGPGDTLFLPAFWYHQVTQEDDTMAVNYWHDPCLTSPMHAMLTTIRQLSLSDPLTQSKDSQRYNGSVEIAVGQDLTGVHRRKQQQSLAPHKGEGEVERGRNFALGYGATDSRTSVLVGCQD